MNPPESDGVRFRVPTEVHTRRFGNELIILELSRGEYFSLDELGARIWEGFVAGESVGDVAERLAPEYDVVLDRLRADVGALAEELMRRGLLLAKV
jgi:hypothetical protein